MNRLTFICAGTSDPQLLTVRAINALKSADRIVADPNTSALLHGIVEADTDIAVVDGTLAQRKKAITSAVKQSAHTVRLIAGDPILDGVLALELQALAGTAYIDVVPGIAIASASAAFSGLSLIAGKAREVRVLDANDTHIDWEQCIDPRTTLVITHGADNATVIFKKLIAAGADEDTPFRIVRAIGSIDQRSVHGELGSAAAAVGAARHSGDGVIIVGEAAAASIDWFENKALFGWRVLLPRTKDALDFLDHELNAHGAETTQVATLSVEPPRTPQQMEKAIAGLAGGRFGWVVFTCANSFNAVWDKTREYGLDARAFAGIHLAAVGEDTVEAMQSRGLAPDLATGNTTSALLDVFPDPMRGEENVNRVLIPRADIATETLTSGLLELGWEVEEVTAFRTVRSAPPEQYIRDAIKSGGYDAVVFTSSATVRNLIGIAGKPHQQSLIACIGPKTAKAAEEHGLRVDVIADEPTHASLVEALVAHAFTLQAEAEAAGHGVWRPSKVRAAARRKAK